MITRIMTSSRDSHPTTAARAAEVADRMCDGMLRVLLAGQAGVGKSMLAARVADELSRRGETCWCISADPGTPAFGPPGAVTLALRETGSWRIVALHALCSLDAARFRLPLVTGVARLAARAGKAPLLVDGPGLVRGVGAAELLQALVAAVAVELVVTVARSKQAPPLAAETAALGVEALTLEAAATAARPGKGRRDRQRTGQWDDYLAGGLEYRLDLTGMRVVGTPPPATVAPAWTGRQVALQDGDDTLMMGEVSALEDGALRLRLPGPPPAATALLLRDAQRSPSGYLATAKPFASEALEHPLRLDSGSAGPLPSGRVGIVDFCLLNGVFGDPLLHLRLRNQRRSLLFDLGEGSRLPARCAHQVTDVFITHAHIDHIAGFLWLLRSRIGDYPPCRMYGPPGLADHVAGLTRGILWDRLQGEGPAFEITEYSGDGRLCFTVRSGRPRPEPMACRDAADGVLLLERGFCIRAAVLSHGSPVLAFAFEPTPSINIRKDGLRRRGLEPGPWLAELKRHVSSGERRAVLELPDGSSDSVAALAADLVLVSPAKNLVYATDFADTVENRNRLVRLAQGAHTLFCEATFLCCDAERALRTAHLTTWACAEIAESAAVARLVPFHFSRRYERDPASVYRELATFTSRVVVPRPYRPDAID